MSSADFAWPTIESPIIGHGFLRKVVELMAYTLKPAADPHYVEEREYASGTSLDFAPISSCVGIVSRLRGQNQVIGVHLGLLSPSGEPFTRTNALQVALILQAQGADLSTTRVFGETDFWVGMAYDALLSALGNPQEDGGGSGLYRNIKWDGTRVAWTRT